MARKPRKVAAKKRPKMIQVSENLKITEPMHQKLLTYLRARLTVAKYNRAERYNHFAAIDKYLNGHIKLDADDLRRVISNLKGHGHKPVDMNAQLTLAHIDDVIGYAMDLMFPSGQMYPVLAPPEQKTAGQALSRRMNMDAAYFNHYCMYARGLLSLFKYNMGGWIYDWSSHNGYVPADADRQNTAGISEGRVQFVEGVIHAGNEITAIDVYNFLWDENVDLHELQMKGEFFAIPERITEFQLRQRIANDEVFGWERILGKDGTRSGTATVLSDESDTHENEYYVPTPQIERQILSLNREAARGSRVNWDQIWNAHIKNVDNQMNLYEQVKIYIWLNGAQFDLIEEDTGKMQLFEITITGRDYITNVVELKNHYNTLPISVGRATADDLESEASTLAEQLLPFQFMMNHELNVHQRAQRRALFGLYVFDQDMIPNPEAIDLTSGVIAANAKKDLRVSEAIKRVDTPDYKTGTEQNVALGMSMQQAIMPTTNPQMVADLQRATKYQAAQLNQTSSRRSFKLVRQVNAIVDPGKRIQYYNLLQYGSEIEMLNEQGEIVTFRPIDIATSKLEFAVGDGLKGIDQLLLLTAYEDLMNSILQRQDDGSIDVLGLLDYVMTLHGDQTSLRQFQGTNPLMRLTPEQQQIAMQLLEQFSQTPEGQAALGQQSQAQLEGPQDV